MGQNNQKDQKGPKMTAAVMLVQNNQNNQKIWSSQISYTILKVRFFWDTLYIYQRRAKLTHYHIDSQIGWVGSWDNRSSAPGELIMYFVIAA